MPGRPPTPRTGPLPGRRIRLHPSRFPIRPSRFPIRPCGPRSPGTPAALTAPSIPTSGSRSVRKQARPAVRRPRRSPSASPVLYAPSAWNCRCGLGISASMVSGAAWFPPNAPHCGGGSSTRAESARYRGPEGPPAGSRSHVDMQPFCISLAWSLWHRRLAIRTYSATCSRWPASAGYGRWRTGSAGYRRSDAIALRMLIRGPVAVGRLGTELGVTRQAARKVIDGLEQRDYVRTERDAHDSRVLNVILTPVGVGYARAVIQVIHDLNREFCERADPAQLAAADAVLRVMIASDSALEATASLIKPPVRA